MPEPEYGDGGSDPEQSGCEDAADFEFGADLDVSPEEEDVVGSERRKEVEQRESRRVWTHVVRSEVGL